MERDQLMSAIIMALVRYNNGEIFITNELLHFKEENEVIHVEQLEDGIQLKLKQTSVIEL